jgi:histidyl-tRNA synthetase
VERVRGTHDHFGDASPLRGALAASFAALARRRGFAEVETPVLEPAALYARSLGGASDVVSKEMYVFATPQGGAGMSTGSAGAGAGAGAPAADGAARQAPAPAPAASVSASAAPAAAAPPPQPQLLALRPEGTAGVMRALIASGRLRRALHPLPQKLFYAGPMFRHERPQKGRYRQFTQLGVEVVGGASTLGDVEAIALADAFLRTALAPPPLAPQRPKPLALTLLVNTLGDAEGMQRFAAALQRQLSSSEVLARLSPESQARVARGAALRVLDSKSAADQDVVRGLPDIRASLGAGALRRFDEVLEGLEDAGVPFVVEPRLVRGLDYYSHTVFEFVVSGGGGGEAGEGKGEGGGAGHLGAVLAGGRYDRLAHLLGHPEPVPSVGESRRLRRSPSLAPLSLRRGPLLRPLSAQGRRRSINSLPLKPSPRAQDGPRASTASAFSPRPRAAARARSPATRRGR